ncbi:MAG TPA: peptidase [Planctomycetota bacterium]
MRTLAVLVSSCLPMFAQQEPQKPGSGAADAAASGPVVLGEGQHTYHWVRGWGRSADAKDLGNTHGCLVVDKDGNVLANTDTESAVVVYSAAGEILRTWGKEFRGGLHGMCLRVEDGKEVLYLAHTRRHELVKTEMDGTVLWTIGWPQASGIYEKEEQFNPTAVAVGPDGQIFLADGYGKSWVHLFDKDRNYVKSFGGPGTEPGKMKTPHGLWLDARGKEPLLLVCDRENHRLQWFTMDGTFVRLMDKDLRRPCNVAPLLDGGLAIADLAGRVTLLDKDDKLVVHLGDNPDPKLRAQNGVPRDKWQDGAFLSPHGICVDTQGSIYVLDWNSLGRVSKLVKAPPSAKKG